MQKDFIRDSIAVLIDADNAQLAAIRAIFDEISKYGRITVKKAYGNWKDPVLKNWEDELKKLAIKPEQQFAYTKGKNSTDIALAIDAMDLLYTNKYDSFVIVSSDADYTALAIRLRETGAYIIGVGEDKTPSAFRNACDLFILTKNICSEVSTNAEDLKTDYNMVSEGCKIVIKKENSRKYKIEEIHKLLKAASETFQDDDGWVDAGAAGSYIKRARPDFELKMYGYSKLSDLLTKHNEKYETKKNKDGKSPFSYKLK